MCCNTRIDAPPLLISSFNMTGQEQQLFRYRQRQRLGRLLAAAMYRSMAISALLLLLNFLVLPNILYSPPHSVFERRSGGATVNASVSSATHEPLSSKEETPPWLRTYIDYHRTALLAKQQTPAKYLRWVCRHGRGCGGTGDRVSGIIQAFYMAICTNRTLLVDWTVPDALEQYLEPRFIQWNASITSDRSVFTIDAIDKKEDDYLNDPYLLPVDKQLIELKTNVWRMEENIMSTSCMKDYLSRYSDGTDTHFMYRKAFWALFQWSPRVLRHVSSLRRQIGLSMTKQKDGDNEEEATAFFPYVAIHLRTGRGATFKDLILKTNNETTWALYYQCARAFQEGIREFCSHDKKNEHEETPIYLAADTSDAKRQFLQWDANIKTLPEMEIYHIDRTAADKLVDAKSAQLDVWSDIKLLVDAACLVMTETSKFSRLGNWLPPQPRCSAYYNDCGPDKVRQALAALDKTSCSMTRRRFR